MIEDKREHAPDPSSLTTAQLLREIESLKELLTSRIVSIEKAVEVAHDDLVRFPTKVQEAVGGLKDLGFLKIESVEKLTDEKFLSVKKQLEQIESARIEQKKDTATAVDVALKSMKDAFSELNASNATAINKSEAATTKQMEQLGTQLNIIVKSFDDKMNDVKERLSSDHGKSQGLGLAWGVVLALIGVSGTIFGIVMSLK